MGHTFGLRTVSCAELCSLVEDSHQGTQDPDQGDSPQTPQFIHRPIPKNRLTENVALLHRPEVPAVVRHAAVISQHEVTPGRHHDFGIGALIRVGRRNVVFDDRLLVDVQLARIDADLVSGNADHALDIALRGIPGITEYDDVAALDRLPAIDELVDEDTFLVVERGHHAGAFDLHWLVEKDDDERRDRQRDDQIPQPYRQQRRRARPLAESLISAGLEAWVPHRWHGAHSIWKQSPIEAFPLVAAALFRNCSFPPSGALSGATPDAH